MYTQNHQRGDKFSRLPGHSGSICNWMEAEQRGSYQAGTFKSIQTNLGGQQSYSFTYREYTKKKPCRSRVLRIKDSRCFYWRVL